MELFRSVNVDWLRLKWYFLGFSLIFSVAGIISMGMHWASIGSPVPLGVDFRGGTQVQVQFQQAPDTNRIRQAMDAAGIKDARIQTYDVASNNEVLISLPEQTDETRSMQAAADSSTRCRRTIPTLSPCATCRWWVPQWASSWKSKLCWPRFTPWRGCWSTCGSGSS